MQDVLESAEPLAMISRYAEVWYFQSYVDDCCMKACVDGKFVGENLLR